MSIFDKYKNRLVISLALIISNTFLYSQNLVLNPGFEEYYQAYREYSSLARGSLIDTLPAIYWYDYHNGTPDYLNKGDILPEYNPLQIWKKIHPEIYSDDAIYDGNAAMGICAYNVTGGMEHITGCLASKLVKDSIYTFSMDICLVDFSYICLKKIGVIFTQEHPKALNAISEFYDEIFRIPLESNIDIDISSVDSCKAIRKVSGEYKASGGERYLTIGLFYQKDYDLTIAMDKFRWVQSKGKKYEHKVLKRYSETPVYKVNKFFNPSDLGLSKQAYYIIDNVTLTLKKKDHM